MSVNFPGSESFVAVKNASAKLNHIRPKTQKKFCSVNTYKMAFSTSNGNMNMQSQTQSQLVAQEAQLLVEEKWVIEALKKIRMQRNSLQIERLHLESLRYKLIDKYTKKPETIIKNKDKSDEPTQSTLQVMTIARTQKPDVDIVMETSEQHCNEEQLDLAVTKPLFNQDYASDVNMEEYDDDEETCENIEIDIGMLMYSQN